MIESISRTSSLGAAGTSAVTDTQTATLQPGATVNEAAGADFGSMLSQVASDAASTVRHAERISIDGVQGRATTQQVVEAVMQAEHTLQSAVAIRDKVVAAYLEISRMQI
jgi:flagellar hook-basal body complex protein FliE